MSRAAYLKEPRACLSLFRRDPNFTKLWAGQTISLFGSMVTLTALPLAAVLLLDASPLQMSWLGIAALAPRLVFALPSGVWADRLRRRPILIAADLGRALLAGSIPLAAALGRLSIVHLYLVVFGTSLLTTLFDAAFRAYLPALVGKGRLVQANSRLAISESAAEVSMPGLTGLLVQVISAPFTMLFDAVSYLFSAGFLLRIRFPEAPAVGRQMRGGLQGSLRTAALEVSEGLGILKGDPRLWAVLGCTGTRDFFGAFFAALYIPYAVGHLGFGPATFGVLISAGGAGALLGAMGSARLSRRTGLGAMLLGSMFLSGLFGLLTPLAASWRSAALGLMLASQLAGDFFRALYEIHQVSLRQAVAPARALGRVNACVGLVTHGAHGLGLLVAGLLGERAGLVPAVTVGSAGMLLAVPWLLVSPIRRLRTIPLAEA